MAAPLYPVASLLQLAESLFAAAGMDADKAKKVAEVLVTGDMVGQRTHGMAQCAPYLEQVEKGLMKTTGEPEVLRDSGSVFVWNGDYLPGPWLVSRALSVACERVTQHGVVTGVIRKSHHIAALASLIKEVTDRGLVVVLACSDPASGFIAPFGGKEPLFTPNPIAVGYPSSGAPVWIDVSTSITTVAMARQKSAAGVEFEHAWLIDKDGRPTTDPHVFDPGAGGTLLPLGGLEYGHKGFGLSLMIEMLTHGLAGFGRPDAEKRWGANVFLQVMDPAFFGGAADFARQADYTIERCHANAPIDPAQPVRMPGEMAQKRMQAARDNGVELSAPVVAALKNAAQRYHVPFPGM